MRQRFAVDRVCVREAAAWGAEGGGSDAGLLAH
jgi:hypothetical protein